MLLPRSFLYAKYCNSTELLALELWWVVNESLFCRVNALHWSKKTAHQTPTVENVRLIGVKITRLF